MVVCPLDICPKLSLKVIYLILKSSTRKVAPVILGIKVMFSKVLATSLSLRTEKMVFSAKHCKLFPKGQIVNTFTSAV